MVLQARWNIGMVFGTGGKMAGCEGKGQQGGVKGVIIISR